MLLMRTSKHREAEELAQRHTARRQLIWKADSLCSYPPATLVSRVLVRELELGIARLVSQYSQNEMG